MHEGEQVELTIKVDRLEIRGTRSRYRPADLIRAVTPDNQPQPMDFPQLGEEAL